MRPVTTFILTMIALAVAITFAIVVFVRRSAEQRRAHEARVAAMAHAALAAAKKKQAAAAAAAAAKPVETATEPAPPPTAVREERECPFCAEPILKKARVCKHCGRDVEPLG